MFKAYIGDPISTNENSVGNVLAVLEIELSSVVLNISPKSPDAIRFSIEPPVWLIINFFLTMLLPIDMLSMSIEPKELPIILSGWTNSFKSFL